MTVVAPRTLEYLFEPIRVGPMEVPNRIVMAPMERNYANPDATVSERTLAHYAQRAHGGVGWIDVESTFVHASGRGRTNQLGLDSDSCIDGFRALAQVAHEGGARIGVELHHAGRNTNSGLTGTQPVAPSPVACVEAGGEVPRALSESEIDEIIDHYAQAAGRAAAAGLDAVELHSAHGYLPLAFLSPRTNLRTDDYGGSLENRMRFALRTVVAIRERVGPTLAVGCRFSAEEHLAGGLTLADTTLYARALEEAGVDYLSVSSGVYESFVRIIPPMDFAFGWMLESAAAIRAAVGVPVIGASRLVDAAFADRAIAAGQVDLVAFGRALLTDPELPRKSREGRQDEVVTCIGCNQGCEARISRQLDVTCLVNPQVGRELTMTVVPARAAKRVVVVGGGPAGMEAARLCAERGHDVTLYEREERLGGMIALAARVPERGGWQTFLEQAARRLHRSGVTVRLGEEVGEAELAGLGADAIVVATGSEFERDDELRASASVAVLTVPELLELERPPGERIVIRGGGAIGLGAAAWCLAAGAQVTVLSADAQVSDPPGQGGLLDRLASGARLVILADRQLAALEGSAVEIVRAGSIGPLSSHTIEDVSAVVLAGPRRARAALGWRVRELRLAGEVYETGDCHEPRSALEAVYDGAVAGRRI